MTTTIKITELSDIGANLSASTVLPVVDMTGTPTTQKTIVGNIANVILTGAGVDYVAAHKATTAETVTTNAQPNITSVGTLTNLQVTGNVYANSTVRGATVTALYQLNAANLGVNGLSTMARVNVTNSANLGAVANVHIIGGTNGQVLTTNGSGNLSWSTVSGNGGGNTGNITFNGDNIESTHDIVNILGNNYAQLQSNNTVMWVEDGEADIQVNDNRWIFNNQGYMEIPNDGYFGALNSSVLSFSSQNNNPIFIEVIDTGNSIAQQWQFDNTGNLTTPGVINAQDGSDLQLNATGGGEVDINGSSGVYVVADNKLWQFTTDGNITLPDTPDASINYANGQPYGGVITSPTSDGTFTTLPDFLEFVGGTRLRTGQTSEGVFFDGNAGSNGTISYPVRTNFSIGGTTKVTVTVDMVVNDECSDFGLCVFESGTQPEWAWAANPTRLAGSYNCTTPYIYTLDNSIRSGYDIPTNGTYRVRFTYDPINNPNIMLETLDTSNNVLDTIIIDGTLNTANEYCVGFAADQDSTNLRTYMQNLTIAIDGGNTYTDSLQLAGTTGNVTFNDVNIIGDGNLYLQPDPNNAGAYLDVYLTSGPDIHIASNSENLILGRDGTSNVMVGIDGNVYVQANTGTPYTWQFGGDSHLIVPGNIEAINTGFPFNSAIIDMTAGSPTVLISLQNIPFPDEVTGQVEITGVIGATQANGTWWYRATSGSQFELFTDSTFSTPVDGTTWSAYISGGLAVCAGYNDISIRGGNVSIRSGTQTWTFSDYGSTIFPVLEVDLHNGGNQQAQLLQFGDPEVQAVITGPTPLVNQNAQRIIIQGQRGSGTGEGGDVYVWGGDSDVNGGDIKIYAGDADSGTGSGGYVNIEGGQGADQAGYINLNGGYSSNGYGGYININGGSSGNGIGGNIQIQAGQSGGGNINGANILLAGGYSQSANGGAVTLRGGQSALGLPGYGNVLVEAGASQWNFDNTGNLQAPGNIVGQASANFTIFSNGGVHDFVFGSDGTFYAPDNVVLGGNSIFIGPGANTLAGTEHAVLIASSNHFAYIQGVINNVSDNGSADWVAQGHHGNDTGGWADMGFTSSGFGDANYTITGGGDGYLFAQGYVSGQAPTDGGGNLVLATGENGTTKDIIFGTGGFSTGNIFGRISDANNSLELSRTGATITFPDATEQNTAWTGSVTRIANGNSNVSIPTSNDNVYITTNNGSSKQWIFNTNGSLRTAGNVDIYGSINFPQQVSNINWSTYNIELSQYGRINTNVDFFANANVIGAQYLKGDGSNITNVNAVQVVNGTSNVKVPTTNGNVVITANGTANWTLDTTGNLTLPTGGQIIVSGGLVSSGASPAPVINGFSIINSVGISGGGNISGNNISATGNVTVTGTTNTGINSIIAGVTNTLLPNTITSFSANVNSYTQVTLQNKSNGADATTDYIITADNGSDTVNYADFGIINSGYDNGTPTNSLGNIVFAADTYLYAQGNVGNTSQSGGNLALGTTVPGKNVKIFAGGVNNSSIVANIANTGVSITGNLSVSGNITGNTNGYTIGYLNIPQVAASNTTLAATDSGKHYYSTTAGNFTLTVPNNATTSFATGTAISIVVQAAGNILVNAASGVTLYMAGNSTAANRVVGGYGMATLMKVSTDTWFINGTGVS